MAPSRRGGQPSDLLAYALLALAKVRHDVVLLLRTNKDAKHADDDPIAATARVLPLGS
jgi:hypothetical protein